MDDEQAVLRANGAFYTAFASADFATMTEVWAHDDGIACIHPGWDVFTGYHDVMESWRTILEGGCRAADLVPGGPRLPVRGCRFRHVQRDGQRRPSGRHECIRTQGRGLAHGPPSRRTMWHARTGAWSRPERLAPLTGRGKAVLGALARNAGLRIAARDSIPSRLGPVRFLRFNRHALSRDFQ